MNRLRGAGKTITEIREEPGKSNAGKYPNVSKNDFAGSNGTYPINTKARGEAALKLAHNSPEKDSIVAKVLAKYPGLNSQNT